MQVSKFKSEFVKTSSPSGCRIHNLWEETDKVTGSHQYPLTRFFL